MRHKIFIHYDFHNRKLLLTRELRQPPKIYGADAALGRVDDSRQMQIVMRIVDDVQIRENILDFLAVVKLQPADYEVRNFLVHETLLEQPRLRIGAVEQRDFVIGKIFVGDEPLNLSCDNRRLQNVIVATDELNFLAEFVLRAEIFGLAIDIVLS